jgi:hypothetical protein
MRKGEEGCSIETAHIPEEEYDGDTIVVAQPIRQRQATVTSSSTSQKQMSAWRLLIHQVHR